MTGVEVVGESGLAGSRPGHERRTATGRRPERREADGGRRPAQHGVVGEVGDGPNGDEEEGDHVNRKDERTQDRRLADSRPTASTTKRVAMQEGRAQQSWRRWVKEGPASGRAPQQQQPGSVAGRYRVGRQA